MQVYEETGYDVRSRLNKRQYIEIHAGLQRVKLFIIKNVSENSNFKPLAKKVDFCLVFKGNAIRKLEHLHGT